MTPFAARARADTGAIAVVATLSNNETEDWKALMLLDLEDDTLGLLILPTTCSCSKITHMVVGKLDSFINSKSILFLLLPQGGCRWRPRPWQCMYDIVQVQYLREDFPPKFVA